jgi:hypothetical protein
MHLSEHKNQDTFAKPRFHKAGAPDNAAMDSLKQSIANHIGSMNEQIISVAAEDAADWIIERMAAAFVLVPKET